MLFLGGKRGKIKCDSKSNDDRSVASAPAFGRAVAVWPAGRGLKPPALIPATTARTTAKAGRCGLKGSNGCGEWNSSGSFTAFRMTAESCSGRCKCNGKCVVEAADGLGREADFSAALLTMRP